MEDFPTYQSRTRGFRRRSNCKICEAKRWQDYNSTHREYKRVGYRKVKAKKYALGGDVLLKYILGQRLGQFAVATKRLKLPPVNVDAQYLMDIFHQQNGLCYYTGEPMIYGHQLGVKQRNSI